MDIRTRRGLLNAMVGKVGKRMDTLLIPLELLCCISRTEFSDKKSYIRWQKRQVRTLSLLFHFVSLLAWRVLPSFLALLPSVAFVLQTSPFGEFVCNSLIEGGGGNECVCSLSISLISIARHFRAHSKCVQFCANSVKHVGGRACKSTCCRIRRIWAKNEWFKGPSGEDWRVWGMAHSFSLVCYWYLFTIFEKKLFHLAFLLPCMRVCTLF